MPDRLATKIALVTGATSNIGRAIAVAFAADGAHVVVSGRDVERGQKVVATIRAAGGTADFVPADLDGSVDRSRALASDAAAAAGGSIDVLVNNAGIFPRHALASATSDDFDRIYGVNVKAPFFLTQAVTPAMVAAGGGAIVNLGSWVARLGIPSSPLYSSSKAALEALTRSWAAELGPRGVRVNAISPGVIRTPDLAPAEEHPSEALMRSTPAGHSGHPDDIAAAAVYLASDEARFVHGTVLDVDGGRVGVAFV